MTTLKIEAVEPENFKGFEGNSAYDLGYLPKDSEKDYMNDKQKAYFRDMLLGWRMQLELESQETVEDLQNNSSIEADLNDQASAEEMQSVQLRTRDRARKLIKKIDEAIGSIDEDEFGYCEETGDPIGISRLLARPIATLCIEAKRRQEQEEGAYAG